jgi:hypothetical protein
MSLPFRTAEVVDSPFRVPPRVGDALLDRRKPCKSFVLHINRWRKAQGTPRYVSDFLDQSDIC